MADIIYVYLLLEWMVEISGYGRVPRRSGSGKGRKALCSDLEITAEVHLGEEKTLLTWTTIKSGHAPIVFGCRRSQLSFTLVPTRQKTNVCTPHLPRATTHLPPAAYRGSIHLIPSELALP